MPSLRSATHQGADEDGKPVICECATSFWVELGRESDYGRCKRLLDAGKHPTFIGQNTVKRNAINGGLLFFGTSAQRVAAAAVAVVNPRLSVLLVLNVHPDHRGHGLGGAIVGFLRPNFVRAIEHKAEWFSRRGYVPIGELKQGRKYGTQIMVRKELLSLAGRVSEVLSHGCRCIEKTEPPAPRQERQPNDTRDHPMPVVRDGPAAVMIAYAIGNVNKADKTAARPSGKSGSGIIQAAASVQ